MKYRPDPDLEFIRNCTSEELDNLVNVLLHNEEGLPRSIVQLPNHSLYKQHAPHHSSYWEAIAGEIQRYGSNPLAALARAGRGKHYIKILDNICGRFSVKYLPDSSADIMERELCRAIFFRAVQHISSKDWPIICQAFDISPDPLNLENLRQTLLESLRLDESGDCLLTQVVAHGSAMHASRVSYLPQAEDKYHPILSVFEKTIASELSTVSPLSFTGSAHWIVIPVILQLAYLRAKKNLENA